MTRSKRARFAVWWRRSGMGIRLGLLIVVGGLLSLLVYWQRPDDDTGHLGNNLLIFFLVNSIIVVLCVLAFLIGRNVVKLVFDRRRKILGSKLRLRLVTAFVGLTLIPTIILFVLASGLLSRSMDNWFSGQIEATVTSAIEVAKQHHQRLRDELNRSAHEIAGSLAGQDDSPDLGKFLEHKRQARSLFGVQLVQRGGNVAALAQNAAAVIADFEEPAADKGALERAFASRESILFEDSSSGSGQFIRAYIPVKFRGDDAALVVTDRVEPELTQALAVVNESFKEYEQLKLFKNPLKSAYILTLTTITMIILFSAIWFGFYIAREIAVPIQNLAEGTRAVAKGNLDFRIREGGDDEMAFLVHSFNTMIGDLKGSRADAERRRLHLETILSNLAVSVIAIDSQHRITSLNPPAAKLFALEASSVIGRSIEETLEPDVFQQFSGLLAELESGAATAGQDIREREVSVKSGGRELKLICTVGKVLDQGGRWVATVLIFDDITELAKAQHMSAWREVAQRIAHEIKNPLTPIQLSAQRLQKLLAGTQPAAPAVIESAQTIIENVDSIKRLANEFSTFARMPVAEFTSAHLNEIVSDTLAPFADSHNDIVFQFIADNRVPTSYLDREQVRRILINLIDNAIAAVRSSPAGAEEKAKVVVKTSYDQSAGIISLEVADNGPGVSEAHKARIFEPYYTTKSSGSGLGLAIVSSCVSDHQGEVRLFDQKPHGARFVVEFPIEPRTTTQRRLAGG